MLLCIVLTTRFPEAGSRALTKTRAASPSRRRVRHACRAPERWWVSRKRSRTNALPSDEILRQSEDEKVLNERVQMALECEMRESFDCVREGLILCARTVSMQDVSIEPDQVDEEPLGDRREGR